jgi:hypothetical protein
VYRFLKYPERTSRGSPVMRMPDLRKHALDQVINGLVLMHNRTVPGVFNSWKRIKGWKRRPSYYGRGGGSVFECTFTGKAAEVDEGYFNDVAASLCKMKGFGKLTSMTITKVSLVPTYFSLLSSHHKCRTLLAPGETLHKGTPAKL